MFKPILILIFMNLIWSGSYVAVKLGLGTISPLTLIFWRMGIAAAILVGWVVIKGVPVRLNRKMLFYTTVLGTVVAASHILWVTGLKFTNASDASLLYSFLPAWEVVLVSVVLKERFRFAMGAGLVIALAGLVVLSGVSFSTVDSFFGPTVAFGNLLIVIGLFCEGMFSIVAKPIVESCPPVVMIAAALIVTEIILSVPVAMNGGFAIPLTARNILILFYLAVPCTVVGFVLWVSIMRGMPVNVMCYTIFVQPVAGAVIAMLVLGEVLGGRVIKGGVFLLAGVAVAVASHVRAHRNRHCEGALRLTIVRSG